MEFKINFKLNAYRNQASNKEDFINNEAYQENNEITRNTQEYDENKNTGEENVQLRPSSNYQIKDYHEKRLVCSSKKKRVLKSSYITRRINTDRAPMRSENQGILVCNNFREYS